MSNPYQSVQYYDSKQAAHYDRDSKVIRGSRDWHAECLRDVLAFLQPTPSRFLELGCGTGFFTSVVAATLPEIKGVAIDGSVSMLAEAKSMLSQYATRLHLREHLFTDIPWADLGGFDLVFSAFAIHHLKNDEKQRLYADVSSCLLPQGCFILFDSFRPCGRKADRLIEYLSCADIHRRYRHETGKDVPLAKVVETDRRKKIEQGDKEASLELTIAALVEVGLGDIGVIFAESRLAGLVAFKDNLGTVEP